MPLATKDAGSKFCSSGVNWWGSGKFGRRSGDAGALD
jgi:hypothetical protein